MNLKKFFIHRERGAALGVPELIAIALGGMVGGGIFSILGVSAAMIGAYTPIAIVIGGGTAALAAYSYVQLGVYYRDEGATYSFMKRAFPNAPFAASLIGWWVIFGYISTLALYAYTFSSYTISGSAFADNMIVRRAVACGIIAVFALINLYSVRGMGKLEDLMVYTKLVILVVISFVLINNGKKTLPVLFAEQAGGFPVAGIAIVSSITFVAYEGFQLVINAVGEMDDPARSIPRAIYTAIFLAVLIYVVIAIGALMAIPLDQIVKDKEYALATGAREVLGSLGRELVIAGAILATCSAISGTAFGASRQMAVIAQDGYFPAFLALRRERIPTNAILVMSLLACVLILSGGLQLILEFGSITFLLVSFLIAAANFRVRDKTGSSTAVTVLAMALLLFGFGTILWYEVRNHADQFAFVMCIYALLTAGSWIYSRKRGIGDQRK
ncbi:MAG: APC family permease [Chlamydiia bacterium]|nr:APC family permease [Chlamydiia bacterium]